MSGRDLIILARLCPNVTLAVAVLGWFSMRWPGLIVIQNFRFGSAVKLLCLLACVLAAMLKRFCMWSAEAVTQETQFVQDRTRGISMARASYAGGTQLAITGLHTVRGHHNAAKIPILTSLRVWISVHKHRAVEFSVCELASQKVLSISMWLCVHIRGVVRFHYVN